MEYDTLRFRADGRINETIRRVAEGRKPEGIYFVDSVAAFDAADPNGIPGSNLFYEHVHMTFKGNYTLARALVPAIQEILSKKGFTSSVQVPTEAQVAERVAFTDFEYADYLGRMVKDMMNKPPFTYQLNHDQWLQNIVAEINRLRRTCDIQACQRRYDAAIAAHPEDWRLLIAQVYFRGNVGIKTDLKSNEKQLRNVLRLFPASVAYEGLGRNLFDQGRLNEAKDILNQLLELRPNAAYACYLLGEIARGQHDYAEAKRQARRAISLSPAVSITPYILLAKTYDDTHTPDTAVRVLNEALEIFPDPEDAAWLYIQLANICFNNSRPEKALEYMDTGFQIQPELAEQEDLQALYERIQSSIKR
jgi:tetratricopeptide (TPR) repeat protein